MSDPQTDTFLRRHPVMAMFIAVAVTIVVCLMSAALWLYSDGDLVRVRAAAKAAGIEIENNTIRTPASDQSLLDALDRLTILVESNDLSFDDSAYHQSLDDSIEYPSFCGIVPLKKGEPIPQHLYDFYQQHMDTSVHNQIMVCIEQLKGHQLKDGQRLTGSMTFDHIQSMGALYRYLCEWMLTLPVEDFRREMQSACVLLESYPRGTLLEVLMKTGMAGLVFETACLRIEDVGKDMAEDIDRLRMSLQQDIQISVHGEWLFVMDSLESPLYGDMIAVRYAREHDLMLMLEMARHSKGDYATFYAYVDSYVIQHAFEKSILFGSILASINGLDQTVRVLQILTSLISKTPMPTDSYGNPFKEIHDPTGTLLGYYSIGADGIDDGWDAEAPEDLIWIYGEL